MNGGNDCVSRVGCFIVVRGIDLILGVIYLYCS